jgi:hypothetical protein
MRLYSAPRGQVDIRLRVLLLVISAIFSEKTEIVLHADVDLASRTMSPIRLAYSFPFSISSTPLCELKWSSRTQIFTDISQIPYMHNESGPAAIDISITLGR